LSLIIVSWNAKAFLLKCLQSVSQEATQCDSEIIVVDNASTDGSAALVKKQFPQMKLITNDTNLGFAKGTNIGIRQSKGKYICLINSDVVVKKDCISRAARFMDDNARVGILGPRILDADGKVQRSCMGFPTLWNTFCRSFALDSLFPKSKLFGSYLMNYRQHDSTRSVDVINGCFWMVRRAALEEVGLLDERFFIYGEDIDFCRRLHDADWDVVFFPEAEAIHYGGASSDNAPIRFFTEMHRANFQYWQKHHGTLLSRAFLFLTLVHHLVRLCGHILVYCIRPKKRDNSRFMLARSTSVISWVFSNLK
jgi:hypothetical protein